MLPRTPCPGHGMRAGASCKAAYLSCLTDASSKRRGGDFPDVAGGRKIAWGPQHGQANEGVDSSVHIVV